MTTTTLPTNEKSQTVNPLADLRKTAGLSQTAVAERMNIVQSRVSAIERGDLGTTHVDTLRAYVTALGATVKLTVELAGKTIDIG